LRRIPSTRSGVSLPDASEQRRYGCLGRVTVDPASGLNQARKRVGPGARFGRHQRRRDPGVYLEPWPERAQPAQALHRDPQARSARFKRDGDGAPLATDPNKPGTVVSAESPSIRPRYATSLCFEEPCTRSTKVTRRRNCLYDLRVLRVFFVSFV
jgi:hypothetical protein